GAVGGDVRRLEELRRSAGAVGAAGPRDGVAEVRFLGSTGDRRHHARRRDLADQMVVAVSDVDVPCRADGDAVRAIEARRGAGAVVVPRAAVAGQRGDDAGRRDLADRVVAGVGDVDIAVFVAGDALRSAKLRDLARAVLESLDRKTSREGRDVARRRDLANRVFAVGDVDVVVRVDGDVRGVPEKCLRAVRVESARSAVRVSGEDADDAGGGDFADLIVGDVGDVDVALRIDGSSGRAVE